VFEWNTFAFISLICFLMSSASAILTLSAKRSGEALLWGLICVLLALWTFGLFLCFSTDSPEDALYWARTLNYIVIFLPALLFHFCVLFVKKAELYKRITWLYYCICLGYFLLVFFFPEHFLHSPSFRFSEFWFPYAGPLFYVFPVLFMFLSGHSVQILISSKSSGNRAHQRKTHYLLITLFMGFIGAGSTLSMEFGAELPPYGIFSIAFVVLIATYAILKHDLLDLPETFSLITARVLIYIIIFTVVVSVIKVGAFFDNIQFSGFQIAVISMLMVLVCELYALMKSRVQYLSDTMLTQRKMTNDRQFTALINQLEMSSDFEAILPLLRNFLEKQVFVYHYAWYLDQSLLGQSLRKESLKDYERNQSLNDSTFQRILFSARDGRRHDRLPASLRLSESLLKKHSSVSSQLVELMNSEQLDNAYEWVDQVPSRELIALPLMANSYFRGLMILVVSQDDIEYADQLMLQTLSAKLALIIERFDSIREESRAQQAFLLEKMNSLQALAGDVAQEMQLPLSQMDNFVSQVYTLSRSLQDQSFTQSLDLASIASKLRSDSNDARLAIERSAQLIEIILRQVQNLDININKFEIYSMQDLISKAFAEYVFLTNERAFITSYLSQDFKFKGSHKHLVFVIFNVLKSALSQPEYPLNFEIHVSTSISENMNWLSVNFNHQSNYRVDKRFNETSLDESFEKSSDLSISYCQKVMKSLSGEFRYILHGNELSEFRLGFPKIL
jgi:hypothetical protein